MDKSPSTYSSEEFEELQKAFEAHYKESIKMVKRNMKLKDSKKKVSLKNEALEQRAISIENEVVSLQEERIINISLKKEMTRQKEENTCLLKEKEDLLMSGSEFFKVSLHGSMIKERFFIQEKVFHATIYLHISILPFLRENRTSLLCAR